MHRYSTYWVEKCALSDVFSSAEEDNYVFKGVSWGYSTDLNTQLIPFLQTTSCPASSSPSSPPLRIVWRGFPGAGVGGWHELLPHFTGQADAPPCQHHHARVLAPQHQCVYVWSQPGCGGTPPLPTLRHTHSHITHTHRHHWDGGFERTPVIAPSQRFTSRFLSCPFFSPWWLLIFCISFIFLKAFCCFLMYMHERFSRNFSDANILSLQTWRLPNRSFFSISSSPR